MARDPSRKEPRATAEHWLATHGERMRRRRDAHRARERRWSWARLVVFGVAVWVWFPFDGARYVGAIASGAGLVLFAWTVRRHGKARSVRVFHDRLLLIIEESKRRLGGAVTLIRSWAKPADPPADATLTPVVKEGATWALTDQERDDLDLFAGPVGVFGLLNRTSSIAGTRRLAALVNHANLDISDILDRQRAVRWLDEHAAERMRLMAGAVGLRACDAMLDRLVCAVRQTTWPRLPIPLFVLRVWSLSVAVLTGVAVLQVGVGAYGLGGVWLGVLLLNALIYLRMQVGLKACLAPWKSLGAVATHVHTALLQAADDLPDEGQLGLLRRHVREVCKRKSWRSLCRWIDWADVGGMLHEFLNVFVFYDMHVAAAICRRVVAAREVLLASLSAVAEVEAVSSLACFAWEQPIACYPVPKADGCMHIAAARHPLISPERVVANDIELGGDTRMWVVTGPNMAGKSTMLRTVGVNTLLAQLGTVAVADSMTCPPVRLVTDLQARDNLADEQSYFLAEVRHIQRMVQPPPGNAPILGMMDEPFRGTNTKERVAASVAVIDHLLKESHLFIVATHETALAELAEQRAAARNFHFHERLESQGMVFDYILRPGPAQARNALLVLEREGYPRGVLERANRWMDDHPDAAC